MSTLKIESVPARLSRNTYNLDEEESHIESTRSGLVPPALASSWSESARHMSTR